MGRNIKNAMGNKLHWLKELRVIPGVGKEIAEDFWNLGIRSVKDLRNKNPENLYRKLCRHEGKHIDRCMLYIMRCAVYFASKKKHSPRLLKWWNWSDRNMKKVGIILLFVATLLGPGVVWAHVPFGEYAGTHVVRFVPEPRSPFAGEFVEMKFYLRDLRGFAPKEGMLVAVNIEEVFGDGREQRVLALEPRGISEIGLYETEYTFSKPGSYRIGYEFWEVAKPDALREATFEMQVRERQGREGSMVTAIAFTALAIGFVVGRFLRRKENNTRTAGGN